MSDTLEVEVDTTTLQVLNGHALASMPKTAELLDCGLSRVYKLLDEGELKSFLVGGRRKVAVSDIVHFIAKMRAQGPGKRKVPWDADGLGPRHYHARRGDADAPEKSPALKAPATKRPRGAVACAQKTAALCMGRARPSRPDSFRQTVRRPRSSDTKNTEKNSMLPDTIKVKSHARSST